MSLNVNQVRSRKVNLIALIVCLCLTGMFLIPLSAVAKSALTPELKIVGPLDKAWVMNDPVFLAGSIQGVDVKTVSVKGAKVVGKGGVIPVDGGGFGSLVTLKKGVNEIEVSAGSLKKRISVYYGTEKSRPKGYKRYYIHDDVVAMNCKECHKFRRGKFDFTKNVPARSNCTTADCHGNKMAKMKYVHGPVGAGVCVSCHNPHGSFRSQQLARDDRSLCLVCHMVKKEEFNKKVVHPPVEDGCTDCHDPHQSRKRFQLKGKIDKNNSVSALCFNCHDKTIFARKVQHGPVGAGDCVACHNPHASDNDKLLIVPKDGGQLCFRCHADRRDSFNLKQVHDPVQDDCGLCHDPHSSNYKKQLHKEVKELCKSCHLEQNPEIFEDMQNAKFKHVPVDEGRCPDCHRPHSSNYEPLLVDTLEKLCFQCHVDLGDDVADSKYRHGPVKTGDCIACHAKIHGSAYSKLFGRSFPMNFYDSYSPTKYDLCFGCHNKDIAKKKNTDKLTNFRDGTFNLHYLHVNRKKGRTCIACHAPHGSSQAKHIREEVPFGGWAYPIQYTKRKNGGTCVVGCHAPKTYDRVNPQLNHDKRK